MTRAKGRAVAHAPLRLGISACLLGEAVRWDGGHRRDPFLTETLGRWVEWVPVCPEVELGLGVPRETIRLEGSSAAPRLVAVDSRRDLTADMRALAERRVAALARLDLSGSSSRRTPHPAAWSACGCIAAPVRRRAPASARSPAS
jgi:hypothetical protein